MNFGRYFRKRAQVRGSNVRLAIRLESHSSGLPAMERALLLRRWFQATTVRCFGTDIQFHRGDGRSAVAGS